MGCNGDTWTVTARHRDGSLSLVHHDHRGRVRLPDRLRADSVELAYAATAHRIQGTTVDTAQALFTPEMTRESFYVASSRGRDGTFWYAVTDHPLDATSDYEPDPPATASEMLECVIARSGRERLRHGHLRNNAPGSHLAAYSHRPLPARLATGRTRRPACDRRGDPPRVGG